MNDDGERVDLVRDDLGLEAQRYEHAASRLQASAGQDSHKVIDVRVAADGTLDSVRVEEGWRRFYDGGSVGNAVLEAYTGAAAERTRLWADAAVDETRPETRTRPQPRNCDSAADSLRNARQHATDWPDFAVA